MTERLRRCALGVFSFTLLVWAVRNWLKTAHEMRRFYTNMPIWDAWDYLPHLMLYRHFDLSVLWIQHNEHREIGTEILFAIDMLLFHGRQILPTLASVAAYLGVLAIFVAFAFDRAEDKWLTGCAALLAFTLAGYKICVVSLTIPFLTSWPQWEFFGVASLAMAVLHKKRPGKLALILAIAFAVAATYSMSNGMLAWPLLFVTALLLGFRMKEVIAIAIVGTAAIGLYFYHYVNLHTLEIGAALTHPGYAIGFLGSFLGMPFSAAYGSAKPWQASLCGWLALAIVLVDAISIVRRRVFAAPTVIVLGGYCVLVLMSATLTTAGRMEIKDSTYLASRAGRYVTEPTLFWCALVLLSVWLVGRAWRGYAGLAFIAAVGVFAAVALPQTREYYAWWEAYFQRGQWAEIAAANGIMDNRVSDVLFANREYVRQFEPVLRDNHLAIFADREPWWIGRRASELFSRGPDGWIHGEVTSVKKLGSDYEVQGWADGATTVVFVDDTGQIVGFGMRPKGGPVELYTHDVPRSMAFTGFIRGQFGERQFSVWALDRKERQRSKMGELQNELPQ